MNLNLTERIKEETFKEFLRFCAVGVVATMIDAAIFYMVRQFAIYQVALVSGYVLSLIANYFLTIYWTFKTRSSKRNVFGVIFAHLLNLFVVRMSLMWLFITILCLTDRISYIPTLFISMMTNFIIVRYVIKK